MFNVVSIRILLAPDPDFRVCGCRNPDGELQCQLNLLYHEKIMDFSTWHTMGIRSALRFQFLSSIIRDTQQFFTPIGQLLSNRSACVITKI